MMLTALALIVFRILLLLQQGFTSELHAGLEEPLLVIMLDMNRFGSS